MSLTIGTAGHIDHGKSSLIKALTGVDPDRLKEEKERGITIELGFGSLVLPNGMSFGVVDVPGHERFVRQMIAGSSGIDIALLVIAADDGIMPQTREHLAVLTVLQVKACVIALTKADLVDEDWLSFVTEEIKDFVKGTLYEDARIVPVSSKTGFGLDELCSCIGDSANRVNERSESRSFRMPIDRVFTIKGAGTVVTGTAWSGSAKVDDVLEIVPRGTKARVRALQKHGVPVQHVVAGERVAFNLGTVKVGEVCPGDMLAETGLVRSTNRFDAYFSYLGAKKRSKDLLSGARVHIAHGTREVIGRLLLMDGQESLASGDAAYVQIRLDTPLPVLPHDHFVVRSYSPLYVMGGGEVLLAKPRRRTLLQDFERSMLDALKGADNEAAVSFALESRSVPLEQQRIQSMLGMSPGEIEALVRDMAANKALVVLNSESPDPFISTHDTLERCFKAMETTLEACHKENPLQAGFTKAELHKRLPFALSSACFDAVLQVAMSRKLIEQEEGKLYHPHAAGKAKGAEEEACRMVSEALIAAKADLVTDEIIAADLALDVPLVRNALARLEKKEEATRLGTGLYIDRGSLEELKEQLRVYFNDHESATVSELRDFTGIRRKHLVLLLEYFDGKAFTKRDGDLRHL